MNTAYINQFDSVMGRIINGKSPNANLPSINTEIFGKSVSVHFEDMETPDDAYIADILDNEGYSLITSNPNQDDQFVFETLQESDEFNERMVVKFQMEAEESEMDFGKGSAA